MTHKFVCLLFIVAAPSMTFAQSIEIKGISIGMTKSSFEAAIRGVESNAFTIAGVKSKYGKTIASHRFRDERLDSFTFFFNSHEFSQVHKAVSSKYPKVSCSNSVVQNAVNASFKQTICTLSDGKSILRMMRFASDISTSVLSLVSVQRDDEMKKERKKDIDDI